MAAVKFASKCSKCGTQVAKGTGDVRKGCHNKWVVTCDAHKPAPRPAARRSSGPSLMDMATRRRPVADRWVMRDAQGMTITVSGDDVHDAQQDGFRVVGRA